MTLLIVIALVTALIVAVRVHQVKTAEKKFNEIKENGFDSPGLPIQPVEDFYTGTTVIETDALALDRMKAQAAKEGIFSNSVASPKVELQLEAEAQPKKIEVKKKEQVQKPKAKTKAAKKEEPKAAVKKEAPKTKKQTKK